MHCKTDGNNSTVYKNTLIKVNHIRLCYRHYKWPTDKSHVCDDLTQVVPT
jgi:hypothetical protein